MTRQTTQDSTFDHDEIEASNVVERYLMGKLTTEETEVFEDHFLDCDECLERLELSKMLYQGMQEVAAEEVTKTLAATSVMAWLAQRGRSFQGILVLGLLTLMALPWAYLLPEVSRVRGEQERLIGEMARALAPQARGISVLLSTERSGADEAPSARVFVGAEPEWIALVLQLPPYQSEETFQIRLSNAEGASLWQSGPLEASPSNQVTLSVHSSWLETSIYHLEISTFNGTEDSPPLARFSFQANRREE